MDCCNYVEPYGGGGHFYQQQNYFCYENANDAYAGYEVPPISNPMDVSARYEGLSSPAYPTDYVYNPKEARLRKAMREQSRELSRRSILQNAIASANARAAGIGGPSAVSVSVSAGSFLDHHAHPHRHHHRFGCVTGTSGLPGVISPGVEAHREPPASWFQAVAAHRAKTLHPNRVADWYGTSLESDPIERLQAMGSMGHHQRNHHVEAKGSKDAMRNQAAAAAAAATAATAAAAAAAECAAAFSTNGYSADFVAASREREIRRHQELVGEYGMTEFPEGQKWHPYQNGSSPHSHPRTPHPQAHLLRTNVQGGTSSHGHAAWGQFCHGVLPHVPAMANNVAVRGPRHAVFLRDRLPNRHCGFGDEGARLSYVPNKIDVDGVRASYPPSEHQQISGLLESSVEAPIDSTTITASRRDEDEAARWEQNTGVSGGISLDGLVPSSTHQETSREKDRDGRRAVAERYETKKRPSGSKQPLPGFHQAFGSTEIGRFSRSEFFVNMVGENGVGVGVGIGLGVGGVGGVDVGGAEGADVSREDRLLDTSDGMATVTTSVQPSSQISSGSVATASTTSEHQASVVATSISSTFEQDDVERTTGRLPTMLDAPTTFGDVGAYCGQAAPRWHSPHVGAIGSEI